MQIICENDEIFQSYIEIKLIYDNLNFAVNPTVSGSYKSSEPYCEWEL